MAHYLVKARAHNLEELRQRLDSGEIAAMRPFGGELEHALQNARLTPDGWAVWEEQCFCSPPLREERAVLDAHFTELSTETIQPGEGWAQIEDLPGIWPE
jgi:hypothetical protein